jgi:cytochrome c oxidase cbb3-type subunit II
MRTVGVPYTDAMIANASADAVAQASPDGDTAGLLKRYGEATQVRAFDGQQQTVTEMDALVAYLQILGKLSDAAKAPQNAKASGR